MVPPVSWTFFIEELRDYLVTELGVADDAALDRCWPSSRRCCRPATGRSRSTSTCRTTTRRGTRRCSRPSAAARPPTGTSRCRTCAEFGPARFEVDDPQQVTVYGLGMGLDYDTEGDWELASPVARPIRFRHTIHV